MVRSKLVGAVAAAMSMAVVGSGRAQVACQGDRACAERAEELFQEARGMMDAGNFSAACKLLDASYALDPGAGTAIALAFCHKGEGRLATALREFEAARVVAERQGRTDRVVAIEAEIRGLEATVPRIRIDAPKADGLVVRLDAARIEPTSTAIAVDDGSHEVSAESEGKAPFHETVVVAPGQVAVVRVHFASIPTPAGKPSTGLRTASWVLGGVGAVALGVGSALGVLTLTTVSQSQTRCSGGLCSPEGYELNQTANRYAVAADILFVTGGVILGTAIVLAVLAALHKTPPPTLALQF